MLVVKYNKVITGEDSTGTYGTTLTDIRNNNSGKNSSYDHGTAGTDGQEFPIKQEKLAALGQKLENMLVSALDARKKKTEQEKEAEDRENDQRSSDILKKLNLYSNSSE